MPSREFKSANAGRSRSSQFDITQMKLLWAHLTEKLNKLMPASIAQTEARKFSEFVPKIFGITADTTVRSVTLKFPRPKGMKHFLFYEAQLSSNEGFATVDTQTNQSEVVIFGGLIDATTYYIRIRVVTADGTVGPWSDIITTKTPQGKVIVTDIPGTWSMNRYTASWPGNVITDPSIPQTVIKNGHIFNGGLVYFSYDVDVTPYTWEATGVLGNINAAKFLFWLHLNNEGFRVTDYPNEQTTIVSTFLVQNEWLYYTFGIAEAAGCGYNGHLYTRMFPTIKNRPADIGLSFLCNTGVAGPASGRYAAEALATISNFQMTEFIQEA